MSSSLIAVLLGDNEMPYSVKLDAGHVPYRVLLVDDEASHRSLEKEILFGPEYILSETENGCEALQQIRENDFDVVLLDKNMPNMDGDEVCYRIRTVLKDSLLPIIMVTGANSHDDLTRSMDVGANDFILKPYSASELRARVNAAASHKRLTDQLDSAESMLFALARMVEAKDEDTGNHCSRLEHMAMVFGQELGLSEIELLALRRAGVLHDIGKLGIPDNILLKKGPLDDYEWKLMRQHPEIGSTLLQGLKSMSIVVPIVRHHHERWDGRGYPDGLKRNNIPYLARVFQVVDIYDALANKRPYKKTLPNSRIIEIFDDELRKGWRDPKLVNTFLRLLKEKPEVLIAPSKGAKDMGSTIYEQIKATGVLELD